MWISRQRASHLCSGLGMENSQPSTHLRPRRGLILSLRCPCSFTAHPVDLSSFLQFNPWSLSHLAFSTQGVIWNDTIKMEYLDESYCMNTKNKNISQDKFCLFLLVTRSPAASTLEHGMASNIDIHEAFMIIQQYP